MRFGRWDYGEGYRVCGECVRGGGIGEVGWMTWLGLMSEGDGSEMVVLDIG